MPYLKSIRLLPPSPDQSEEFPFSIPIVRTLSKIELRAPVTFLVGENGSGKSTLLEALATAIGLPAIGSENLERDETLAHARRLGRQLKLTWSVRTHRGFFLRAEDFFGFCKYVTAMKAELRRQIREYEDDYKARGRSAYALSMAKAPLLGSLAEMETRYGGDLDARSHGESFLHLFQSRFVPEGIYLMDEPEVPLSPQNQLALLALLKEMVDQRSQFLIATHSPILTAYPGAEILNLGEEGLERIAYDDFEHVRLTRAFLNDPRRYLRHLFEE